MLHVDQLGSRLQDSNLATAWKVLRAMDVLLDCETD
jgi:hypothetical protein